MRRTWPLWSAFLLCLGVVLAAMAWISATALNLDESETRARRQAALEENVCLALWRIDSALSPVLAQESARPYIAYKRFVPASQAAGQTPGQGAKTEELVSSPFSAATSPYVLVYFQFEPDGRLTSPSVPASATDRAPKAQPSSADETVRQAQKQLDRIRALTDRQRLSALLPRNPNEPVQMVIALPRADNNRLANGRLEINRMDRRGNEYGANDFELRNQSVTSNAYASQIAQRPSNTAGSGAASPGAAQAVNTAGQRLRPTAALDPAPGPTELGGALMTPLWIGGELFLVRRIAVNGRDYFQGCLLDWPAIKSGLLETVSDLLPQADLLPVAPGTAEDQARMLAALPLRLVPGVPPADGPELPSPIRWILPVAWAGVLLAAAAVAALLASVVRLGQRRADFVSAVTHELRTPLTTFHMYTEMLSEGMVPDPQQQREYLNTLRSQASRLSHMVENVLAFARLERRRVNGLEPVTVAGLLACRERLADRASQAGMELLVEPADEALTAVVRANPSVVEQILFNLVDNACKYASAGEDKRIRILAASCPGGVQLKICDQGPGLPRTVARKLFRPFSKSAQEAANSAPGIGLGLALSKRLACDMGGNLSNDPKVSRGATFVLFLPGA
jgi:signal transduction histidine kinase